MLNLGEFIQLYDTKERGNDINIKINNDTPLHQSILDLERTICDTKSEKEYDVWLYRKDKGVPVGEGVQKDIVTIRDALGLDYHFDFEK